MGLIMAANLLYMIPNGTLTPTAWMLIGSIAGYIRWHRAIEVPKVRTRLVLPYSRFGADTPGDMAMAATRFSGSTDGEAPGRYRTARESAASPERRRLEARRSVSMGRSRWGQDRRGTDDPTQPV